MVSLGDGGTGGQRKTRCIISPNYLMPVGHVEQWNNLEEMQLNHNGRRFSLSPSRGRKRGQVGQKVHRLLCNTLPFDLQVQSLKPRSGDWERMQSERY